MICCCCWGLCDQHDSWDGLPYPQILALPTFKFTARETKKDDATDESQINNTLCVCLSVSWIGWLGVKSTQSELPLPLVSPSQLRRVLYGFCRGR